jgi:hypothetical protein
MLMWVNTQPKGHGRKDFVQLSINLVMSIDSPHGQQIPREDFGGFPTIIRSHSEYAIK